MSRGLSTIHQFKVIHKKYCSLYSANIGRKTCSSGPTSISFSHIACINHSDREVLSKCHKKSPNIRSHLPYLSIDLNFVRNLSSGQKCFEAAGGPPPSPPDGTSGGAASSGDSGGSDDRLVCPKCGSPCEHVNAFVAATRYTYY